MNYAEHNVSHERDEARTARRSSSGQCYSSHRMQPTRTGGGICTACGLTVDREEL